MMSFVWSRRGPSRLTKLAVASILAGALIATNAPSGRADEQAQTGEEDSEVLELFAPASPTDEGYEALTAGLGEHFDDAALSDYISPTVALPVGVDAPRGYATFLPELGDEVGLSGGDLEGDESITISLEGSNVETVTDGIALSSPHKETGQNGMAQTTSDGGQIAYVIEDASSRTDATFSVDAPTGASWRPRSDGGLDLLDASGDPLVSVEAPWAVDATGKEIPTKYEYGNGYIKQVVDAHNATFPVVADPSFGWYAKKAVLCLANIAAFGSIGAKAASVGAKIYKRLKAAKSGTQLAKAFKSWKKLGGTNSARAKALWSTLKEFAKEVRKVGFAKAKHKVAKKSSKFNNGIVVLFGAAGLIGDVFGVSDCIALVRGKG